jgi:hypothetical protein
LWSIDDSREKLRFDFGRFTKPQDQARGLSSHRRKAGVKENIHRDHCLINNLQKADRKDRERGAAAAGETAGCKAWRLLKGLFLI